MEEKMIIINTRNPENQEKAKLPFVVAAAGQTMEDKVTVILQSSAVLLA